ncbi:d(CMP) kinase [Patescibacteria group bacterium]|nr:d(CMP) kinase [Patescibacteria group bacterium]
MKKSFTIAIDGPVAAGKGTIAPELAKKIGGFYLYTGGTYRALALMTIEEKIDADSMEEVIHLIQRANIGLEGKRVFLNGKDVTERIKEQDVASVVPTISSYKDVREAMTEKQRKIASDVALRGQSTNFEHKDNGVRLPRQKAVVAEGRDVATVLFPDAEFKLFLTASTEVRARRRLEQFNALGYENIAFEEVLDQIVKRDAKDVGRSNDPLIKEPEKHGYFVLDNSSLTEEETIEVIIKELQRRGLLDD